jgi:SAM-dependent methyltransferase
MTPQDESLRPGDDEIEAAFAPFIVGGDADAAARETSARVNRDFLRRLALGWLRRFRRTQASVAIDYDAQWQSGSLREQLSAGGTGVPCEWRGRGMIARGSGTRRIHLLHLFRAVQRLRPSSVLEVGAGNGVNLMALAARFPEIRLAGIELTAGGVKAAQACADSERLPEELLQFLPEPAVRTGVRGAIEFRQASAAALPFGDASFDLVFSALALEQMEEIRHQAISEMVRVAKTWVIMIEPFRDFNDEGLRRRYIRAQDYFSARVADLGSYGLEPLFVSADMPHKLTLKPAVVVARKKA